MRPPTSGDRIGPYILEERIGRGGFGEVWRARHSVLEGKFVAAKIPTDPAYVDLLRREGVLQNKLSQPSIVELIELDLDHEPPYLLMELVEGGNLRELLKRKAPLPLDEVRTYSYHILHALRVAHDSGTVHRDLKPENVLLPQGGGITS